MQVWATHWTHCFFMPAYTAHEAGALLFLCCILYVSFLQLMPAGGGSVGQVVGAPAFSWSLLFLLQRHGLLEYSVFCGFEFSPVLNLVQSMIVYSMECEIKSLKENLIFILHITHCLPHRFLSHTGSHATGFWPIRPFRFNFFLTFTFLHLRRISRIKLLLFFRDSDLPKCERHTLNLLLLC